MKRMLTIVLALVLSLSVATPALAQSSNGNDGQPMSKVFIGFDQQPGPAEQALVHQAGGIVKYTYHIVPVIAASVPQKAIDKLLKNPQVAYIEKVGTVSIMGKPEKNPGKGHGKGNREAAGEVLPWGVDRIDADLVWGTNGDLACDPEANIGAGIQVAIMDTGIDYTHPDLKANYKGGYDFVNNDDDPKDDNGHGTHCAGIVAAEGNTEGVIGVAPGASLYALKVLNGRGSGSWDDVVAALEWCVDSGMQVVSMSFGGTAYPSAGVKDAFDNAYANGTVLVAAAGNHQFYQSSAVVYPAKFASVIAVSATDKGDKVPSWSNYGLEVELAAPGVDILSTWLGGEYEKKSGTSMACPHVSGTAALVLASGVSDNATVRQRLQETADDLGVSSKDNYYGYGLVDAEESATGTQTNP
jgi:subtilisin